MLFRPAARTPDQFAADEAGSIDAMAYVFMVTIIGIGLVCALSTVRDQIAQGLGDVADAVTSVNQSYTVNMTFAQINGPPVTLGFSYADTTAPVVQVPGQPPAGMQFVNTPSSE